MKQNILIICILAVVLFNACNQSETKNTASADSTQTDSTAVTPVAFKSDTAGQMYTEYLKLKDALVSSDAATAKTAAASLQTTLAKVEGCEITAGVASKIAATDNIITQRKQFTILSSDIIAYLKHADIKTGSVFVQYCPMANNNDGGYWLSDNKTIRNPYYGDEMLECGEVKEEIKKI